MSSFLKDLVSFLKRNPAISIIPKKSEFIIYLVYYFCVLHRPVLFPSTQEHTHGATLLMCLRNRALLFSHLTA